MRHDLDESTIIELNRRFHDEVEAPSYDQRMGVRHSVEEVQRTIAELERVLGEPMKGCDVALDLGAGTGNLAVKLALDGRAARVIAVDVSSRMLAQADRAAREHGCVIETLVSDMRPIPLPDASVDLVVGCAVLHHVPDVAGLMKEVFRVLKPGGQCIFIGEPSRWGGRFTDWVKSPWVAAARLRRILMRSNAQRWDHEHIDVHTFSVREVIELTRGFINQRIHPEGFLEPMVDQAVLAPAQLVFGKSPRFRKFGRASRVGLSRIDELIVPHVPIPLRASIKFSATRPPSDAGEESNRQSS